MYDTAIYAGLGVDCDRGEVVVVNEASGGRF